MKLIGLKEVSGIEEYTQIAHRSHVLVTELGTCVLSTEGNFLDEVPRVGTNV